MKKNLILARTMVMVMGIAVGVLLLVVGSILQPDTLARIISIALLIYGVVIIIGNIPSLVSGILHIHTAVGVVDLIFAVLGIALGVALVFYRGEALVIPVAVYMVIIPIIRVLLAKKKIEQLKQELLRILLGVVLWLFVPGLVGATAGLLHWLLFASGCVVIGLSILFGVIEIIRIAIAKEIIKASASEQIYVDFEENRD